ncbi:A24 family peptidase [Streptomyces sp. A3M-1-3]|uniref:prepilin peptidase n=1 Tax=Streptomyces sp. A3M-1-3 TaxID=2962044 RepID=UPI0020B7D531|nr:A24 family peptidase [Streptomyces sp. A3M-1-3]MCP3820700.1 A24 family peptidase [Streptomyces sp. A3M-1-3]
MHLLLIVLAAGFGAAAGLLLPRAAYRLAVEPDLPWRTECPAGHPLTGPAAGWLGPARCRPCAAAPPPALPDQGRYGVRPAAAALLTGGVCAALAAAAGAVPEVVVWVLLAPVVVLLALVDRAVHRLPDALTLPLAAAAATLLGVAALVPGAAGSWRPALLGGLALGCAYFVLFLINPNGMGFGDVKLALALGVALGWYGWGVLLVGAFAGFLYGAVYGLGLVLRGRAGRKTAMPFGPSMAAGAFTGLLLGALGT